MERLVLLVFVAMALTCLSTVESSDMDIGRMIQHCDPKVSWLISARKFQDYGCYCFKNGPTGGIVPLDGTDECCKQHNQCYARLTESGICEGDTFGQRYGYKKITTNGVNSVLCTSDPEKETCKYELCRCDAAVAQCFGENDNSVNYHSNHKGVSKSLCKPIGG